jgi:esterase/lipase superfamily enzyme
MLIIAFGAAAVVWLCCRPALAEETAPRLLRVPVYFITDRNMVSDSPSAGAIFGPHRKYITNCLHDPYMGLGYCVVENTAQKKLSSKLSELGWTAAEPGDKVGDQKNELFRGSNFPEIETDFYSKVRQAALKSDRKEILLFVHGYKNPFENAMRTTGRFAYQFENPVILYSWPSVAKVRSYSSDENNCEWSQEHFNEVIMKLEETCTTAPTTQLRIFAHSMGSRLVVRATPLLREKPFLTEVGLICPDVDDGLVKHYTYRYLSAKGTAMIRLYMSQHDKALAVSQIFHGGYTRLGECADSIASFAKSALQFGSKQESDAPEAEALSKDLIEKTKHRMQTVDFTQLDSGLLGHKIPVSLVYNMSYTNLPGPGLQLINERSGQRSKTSRFLSSLTHLKTDSPSPFSNDNCMRVVRSDTVGQVSQASRAH